MGILAGIGTAIAGAAGTIFGQKRQHKYNKQLAQYNFDRNLEMWNMQNEYNTPKAQMDRFKDAGLNPNLIYGQGSPGNASNMPQYSQEAVDVKYDKAFESAVKSAQIAKLKADTDLTRASARKERAEAGFWEDTKIPTDRMYYKNLKHNEAGLIQEKNIAAQYMNMINKATMDTNIAKQNAQNINQKEFAEWEQMLRKENLMPTDPFWTKQLYAILKERGEEKNLALITSLLMLAEKVKK